MLEALSRKDQHGQFRKPVTGQDIDGAAFDHFTRGTDPITKEP
jgi:hypothetical protein